MYFFNQPRTHTPEEPTHLKLFRNYKSEVAGVSWLRIRPRLGGAELNFKPT
jgi:hypothetical protein